MSFYHRTPSKTVTSGGSLAKSTSLQNQSATATDVYADVAGTREIIENLRPVLSRDEAMSNGVPGAATVHQIGGHLFKEKVGGILQTPNLALDPIDGSFDVALAGSASDLANDFAGVLAQMLVDCQSRGLTAVISRNPEGSPYQCLSCNPVFTGNRRLSVRFEDGAHIVGIARDQQWDMDGTRTVFAITDFDPTDGVSAMFVDTSDGSAQKVFPWGTGGGEPEFALSGNTLTLSETRLPGFKLVISSKRGVLSFDGGIHSGHMNRLYLFGRLIVDCSELQAIKASASGTACSVNYFENYDLRNFSLDVLNNGGGLDDPWDQRTLDSALVTLGNLAGTVGHVRAERAMDLVWYDSGGGIPGGGDQARFTTAGLIEGVGCSALLKTVRENVGCRIQQAVAIDCGTGPLDGDTNGLVSGFDIHVDDLYVSHPRRYGLDWRDTFSGCSVGTLTVRNPGRDLDGNLIEDAIAAVRFSSAKLVQIGQCMVHYEGMDPVPGLPAVLFNGGGNYGNDIGQLVVKDMGIGVQETGLLEGDTANSVRGKFVDVAQPLALQNGSSLRYDIDLIDTTGPEVVSKRHSGVGKNAIIPDRSDFQPIVYYQHGSATITPSENVHIGVLRRTQGGWFILCTCRWLQEWSGDAPSGLFRVSLENSGLLSAQGRNARCNVTNWNNNMPFPNSGTQIIGFMEADDKDMRFHSAAPGRSSQEITADDFAAIGTNRTVHLEFELFVPDSLELS